MIDIYTILKEKVESIKKNDIPEKGTVWIRCFKPDTNEVEELADISSIPKGEFEELLEEDDDHPRIEKNPKYTLIVFKAPLKEGDTVTSVPIYIFIRNNIIITLETEKVSPLVKIHDKIMKRRAKFLFNKSVGFFLLSIIDNINDEFFSVIEKISDTSEFLKERIGEFSKRNIERIYSINTTLSYFNRALLGNVEVLKNLRGGYHRFFTPKDKAMTEDIYFDALSLIDTETVQRGVITGLFNIESVMNDYTLNQSMKRLTSIMMVLMIPTLISGIYGMNIQNLPFAGSTYGFFIITGIMLGFIVLSLLFLRKWDWL